MCVYALYVYMYVHVFMYTCSKNILYKNVLFAYKQSMHVLYVCMLIEYMLFCQVNFVLYVSNSNKEYNYAHTYLHMCTFRCWRCTPIYSRTFQDSPAHCERQERPSIQQYSSTVLISLSIFLSLYPAPSPSRKNSRYYNSNC